MRFHTLNDWLTWQESLHTQEIDLGLDRIQEVMARMALGRPPFTIISVAGTNGKGSVVTMLTAIYMAAGYRVGSYTSPHLLTYNERIRVQNEPVNDQAICEAFARVDQARDGTSLTYFEFGTLAAFDIFFNRGLDIVILEVGLGGRLDAVNVLDADVAVITSIGIDHTAWLGDTRDAIAREKAGIFRPRHPAVCGDDAPPATLVRHAEQQGTPLFTLGRDYGYVCDSNAWRWWGLGRDKTALPLPNLRGKYQLRNAATAVTVVELLAERHPVGQNELRAGLATASLPGRFQVLPGSVTRILDVAHNPHAAAALAQSLGDMPCLGKTHAVVAMLADKDIAGVVKALAGVIDVWHIAGLDQSRGASSDRLAASLNSLGIEDVFEHARVGDAYASACERAQQDDRIVIFGSFYTVAAVLATECR